MHMNIGLVVLTKPSSRCFACCFLNLILVLVHTDGTICIVRTSNTEQALSLVDDAWCQNAKQNRAQVHALQI